MSRVDEPSIEYRTNVNNQSTRSGKIKLLPIHTTESPNRSGIADIRGIAEYFDTPSVGASSTLVIDGAGSTGRLMRDRAKPWTQAAYNSYSLSIENIGYSSTTRKEWLKSYPHQLAANAKWLAYWSDKHQIPLRRAVTINGGVQRTGVATHKQLGSYGGNHGDPGQGFPIDYLIKLARYFKLRQTKPNSWKFRRARKQVNKIRKYWGLKELK